MSTLLQTRLPIAPSNSETVDSDTYNRLVRTIELNIGSFNPDDIRTISTVNRDQVKFNDGSLIWNTDIGVLQVYTGGRWQNISVPTAPKGFEASAEVGIVTLKLGGATTITL